MIIRSPIQDFLLKHASENPISFHMPGHKGSALYRRMGYGDFLNKIMDCDITEITGADNLFQAEGIIREAQERYAAIYGVKKSYLQINGSSGANIAAMLASVHKGKKIIMARNCHKSAFNALVLGDIKPVYVYPEMIEKYGISGPVSTKEVERLLIENHDAEAVILPSPNYYGICSDIRAIAEVVHKYDKVLIVDQAHGAHLKFFRRFGIKNMPESAEEAGADIIVNSIHKTLASLTESAVLNLNSNRVDSKLLEDKLQAIESTSPSYLLMASLDINTSIIEEAGAELFGQWAESLEYFYREAAGIKGLKYIDRVSGFDWTKMNFGFGELGIMGDELERLLVEKYGIFIELFTGDLVMCMSGIGNTPEDVKHLVAALKEIAEEHSGKNIVKPAQVNGLRMPPGRLELCNIPQIRKSVPLSEAEGLICAASIIPYPPGIPYICPGERITAEAITYIRNLRIRGEKVIGVDERGCVLVGL